MKPHNFGIRMAAVAAAIRMLAVGVAYMAVRPRQAWRMARHVSPAGQVAASPGRGT